MRTVAKAAARSGLAFALGSERQRFGVHGRHLLLAIDLNRQHAAIANATWAEGLLVSEANNAAAPA